jgi:hypothetical protein
VVMKSIRDVAGGELAWVQPARTRQAFELRSAGRTQGAPELDEVVGTLVWARMSLATGETADGSWTFKREGFWHPRVTVRLAGSEDNIAQFSPNWGGGGTLDIVGHPQFRFGSANFWRSQWDWLDSADKPLVHFKSRQGLLKLEGQVEIEPQAIASPDAPLLVVLGWYLLVLFARDAAASSAGTVAVMGGATI